MTTIADAPSAGLPSEQGSQIETSVIRLSEVLASASTFRLDAEYYKQQNVADEKFAREHASGFRSFRELGIVIDASAFYPALKAFYGDGDLPFLRVADVAGLVDFEGCERIPDWIPRDHSASLKTAQPGDIVLTKGGSVARAGLITQTAAVSRDLILIKSSNMEEADRIFLFLYLQTAFFKRILIRSSSQTAQPHLTTTLVKMLPVYSPGNELKQALAKLVLTAFDERDEALRLLDLARQLVLKEAGLSAWSPSSQLTFERPMSEVFANGRIDAEHFHPKHAELSNLLGKIGQTIRLGDCLQRCERGGQPDYADAGVIVVNSKHVRSGHILVDERNRKAVAPTKKKSEPLLITKGDILLNGTGVGTIGRAAAYLDDEPLLPDNHVTVLRLKEEAEIDPGFLAAELNSLIGQLQVSQRLRGSSGQIELYPDDVREFRLWVPDTELQQAVSEYVKTAAELDRRSHASLQTAIEATELAFSDSEGAALEYSTSGVQEEQSLLESLDLAQI